MRGSSSSLPSSRCTLSIRPAGHGKSMPLGHGQLVLLAALDVELAELDDGRRAGGGHGGLAGEVAGVLVDDAGDGLVVLQERLLELADVVLVDAAGGWCCGERTWRRRCPPPGREWPGCSPPGRCPARCASRSRSGPRRAGSRCSASTGSDRGSCGWALARCTRTSPSRPRRCPRDGARPSASRRRRSGRGRRARTRSRSGSGRSPPPGGGTRAWHSCGECGPSRRFWPAPSGDSCSSRSRSS